MNMSKKNHKCFNNRYYSLIFLMGIFLKHLNPCTQSAIFVFFDKLKNEIQNFVLRFWFYFNKEDEMQITDIHV